MVLATGILCGGLVLAPQAGQAGLPAPLPSQIPIRNSDEPPASVVQGSPFVPAPTRHTAYRHRRKKVAHRRRAATPRVRQARQAPKPPQTPPASSNRTEPKLGQRQEPANESIMALDPLLAPLQNSGSKPAPAAPAEPKPAPAPPASPAPAPAAMSAPAPASAPTAPTPTPAPAPKPAPTNP